MAADRGSALVYCAGGGIGDSLMATLVARALRGRYGRVDALTLPQHAATLERVPDVDGVLVDDARPEDDLARSLREREYAACVVTWATPRTARVPHAAGIRVRVGQSRRLYSWRFNTRVDVRSEAGDFTSHWSQILLDYARAIGCEGNGEPPRFEPTDDDRAKADVLLRELGVREREYALLHTTNAIAPQRGIWPDEGWIALARALRERFGVSMLLSGSEDDRAIVERIAAESGATAIAGRTGIGAFGALAARARFFAGITTGSMHVAAAVGAPTAGIFPFQTDTPERWAPLGSRVAVVRATYPCRPGERKETCPDYACIANLNVPQIVAAVESLVNGYMP